MKIKKNSIILVNHCKHFICLSLWLTVPSLLLNTAISINSASAADDIEAKNQNSKLITDKTAKAISLPDTKQVVKVAELAQKVESIPEQKQPEANPQNGNINTDDVNKTQPRVIN